MSLGTSLCSTLELNLLPKTLKRLHLDCVDVFLLLIKQNVNMNDLLPVLQSLRLCGNRLCEKNLKNLPSNLIELEVRHRERDNERITSSTIFCDLPRSIQRLTLDFEIEDLSVAADLPSDLISLCIEHLRSKFNWFSKLPKSLKSLKIRIGNFEPDWNSLPPQLEELAVHGVGWMSCRKADLAQFPQSLIYLKLWRIDDINSGDELISLLPKNLTRLKHVNGVLLDHSSLQQLPVTLTDYQAKVIPTNPDIVSFIHPDTIRIHLERGPFSKNLNFFPFPTKLQYLSIYFINDDICNVASRIAHN